MNRRSIRLYKTAALTIGIVGSLTAGAFGLSYQGFTLAEYWRESRSGTVLSGADTRDHVVALTFDDGPDPTDTPQIRRILRDRGVHATFFEEGRFIDRFPLLSRQLVADGNVLGNHTFSHPYLERGSAAVVRTELLGGEESLERFVHVKSHLFRPPRGRWNPSIYREARREGDHIILWTVAVEHHDVPTPRQMADRALRLIRPGGILLLHDGAYGERDATVQALPLILDGLRRQGYRCVTVPELLHIAGDEPLGTSRQP